MTQTELDVPPSLTCFDVTDGAWINAITIGYNFLRARISANIKNLLVSQFGSKVSNAKSSPVKFLDRGIARIIRNGSNEQMSRIDTRFIVASMTNAHSFGNRPIPMFVREPMSRSCTTINFDLAVPVSVPPYPTFVNFVKPCHESSEHCTVHSDLSLTRSSSSRAIRWITSTIVSPVKAAIKRSNLRVSVQTFMVTNWCFMVAILLPINTSVKLQRVM